ncbi:TIGR03943 family protein [Cyanobacteria bacterium FACHB-472]|nr:TIGR03943 family protein [Cyanobacteria bacterium FACHB-472]
MTNQPKLISQKFIIPSLDVLALLAWGILLLKYRITGQLYLLIHEDYFWLVIVTGISLLILAVLKAVQLLQDLFNGRERNRTVAVLQHITLFPPGWSSILLLATAILGLLIAPRVFTSATALERGVTESISFTRSNPQAFRSSVRPEQRSLIDWVRTLNFNPEPDAYTGQKAKVQGFVVHPPELPPEYLLISRFIITCCAADAYPVGLPVKLIENRNAYIPDTWLEIEGEMITETFQGKRQLTIKANSLKKIDPPKNPYDY